MLDGRFEHIAIPYLDFDTETKNWTYDGYNNANTQIPLKSGQLIAIKFPKGCINGYWSDFNITGIINLPLQNINGAIDIGRTKIGVVVLDNVNNFINIIS